MANIDLGNLTRYDSKIKQYTDDKYLSKNTANWQMTEKAGAVTCYPVPDTELEPIIDFSFKEIPPVSGDKSPSNPSTIEGVNSISLTRCGKNLIDASSLVASNTGRGVTWTSNNGIVTINRTEIGSKTAFYNLKGSYNNPSLFPAGTYTFARGIGSSNVRIGLAFGNTTLWNEDGSVLEKTFTLSSPVFGRLYYALYQDSVADSIVTMPQLELGIGSTKFEKGEGNTYTYSLGNTYYGGSVNLATGMMTVMHAYAELDDSYTTWTWESNQHNSTTGLQYTQGYGPSFFGASTKNETVRCSHFAHGSFSADTVVSGLQSTSAIALAGTNGSQLRFAVSFETKEEWLNWLAAQKQAGTPVQLVAELATPQLIQLIPQQIKSLSALDKNTPRLNTLYTDADSIQVGYQKHPARTAYEFENAILALGGGE